MPREFNISKTVSLIGDPTRALMLTALVDGRALTAGELSAAANVSPSTASEHLAKLNDGGLLRVARQGRHRYYRLADATVADALEALMRISPEQKVRKILPRIHKDLVHARSCYDHLAGRVAVAMTDAMLHKGYLEPDPGDFRITTQGERFFEGFGLDLAALRRNKRRFARPCLDWSERRYHLAGALGAGVMQRCLARGWIRRQSGSRAISVTPGGHQALNRALDLASFLA